ncbi:MAG TPA: hypothetical protein PLF89_16950, partial [bacterium]|nr:hypothetical protein [bacterium]
MVKRYVFTTLLAALLIMGCSSDHGLAPQPGRLVVDVFFRGTPPPTTQGIYLIVAPQFPPHAINELYHSSNSLPIGRDSVRAVIDLPYGHYDAISLWWYSNETKSNLADVLALPIVQDSAGVWGAKGFDLTRNNPSDYVKLYPDWNKVNRDASLEGTITFSGPFPKNTLATAIAAYAYEPKSNIEYLLYMKSIDFSIGANPYKFKLPIRSGTVSYLVVLWLPERAAVTGFTELGFYQDPGAPGLPAKLKIKAGETRTGLDIQADWSKAEQAVWSAAGK